MLVNLRAGLCGAALLLGGLASAQPMDESMRAAARDLAQQGVAAYEAGDFATATEKLERAYQVMSMPTIALWSARALTKGGRLLRASERYGDALRWTGTAADQKLQARAQEDASKEREALQARIPALTLVIEGGLPQGAEVTLDGKVLPAALVGVAVPVDPGQHTARVSSGTLVAEQVVQVAEAARLVIPLKLASAPAATPVAAAPAEAAPPAAYVPPAPEESGAPAPSPGAAPGEDQGGSSRRTVGLVVGGVGVVALGVGGAFLAVALGKKSDSDRYCRGTTCTDQRGVKSREDAVAAGNLATVAGLVGVVGLSAGAFLFFTAPSGGTGATGFGVGPMMVSDTVGVGGGGIF